MRVLPTPGHTPGHQSVLVDTDDGLVVLAGDVGYTWKQFDASESGQLLHVAEAAPHLARAPGRAARPTMSA